MRDHASQIRSSGTSPNGCQHSTSGPTTITPTTPTLTTPSSRNAVRSRTYALGGYWLCTSYDDIHAVLQDAPIVLEPLHHRRPSRACRPPRAPAARPTGARQVPTRPRRSSHLRWRRCSSRSRAIAVELLEPIAERGGAGASSCTNLPRRYPSRRLLLGWLGFPPEGFEHLVGRLDEEAIRQNIATRQGSLPSAAREASADRYFRRNGDGSDARPGRSAPTC